MVPAAARAAGPIEFDELTPAEEAAMLSRLVARKAARDREAALAAGAAPQLDPPPPCGGYSCVVLRALGIRAVRGEGQRGPCLLGLLLLQLPGPLGRPSPTELSF